MTDRKELRAAIAARAKVDRAVADAAGALARAQSLLADAAAELTRHAGLDDRIRDHHAGAVSAWAHGDAVEPVADLPAELAQARQERDLCRARHEAAEVGVAHLRAAHAVAVADQRRAQGAVSREAERILVAYLDQLEAQWTAAVIESDRLGRELHAGATVWLATPGSAVRPLAISREVQSALRLIEDRKAAPLLLTQTAPGPSPAAARFQDWHRRLMLDPDAELEPVAEPAKAAA
jgi:hypothetical protein